MKRIIALVVGIGLVASVAASQELGVGFARAIDSGEREMDGVALSARLVSVLGESVYVVRSSNGETAYVNAESGRVGEVEEAETEEIGRGGRGATGDLGVLLETVGATIDWDRIISAARSEAGREDIHAVGVRFAGGAIATYVAFGSPHSEDTDLLMVAVDPEDYTVVESFEPGPMERARRRGFAPDQGRSPAWTNNDPNGRSGRGGGPGMTPRGR